MDEPGSSGLRPSPVEEDEAAHDSDSALSTDEASTCTVSVSILERLRSPPPSDLARKRKVQSNPPKGRKRSKSCGSAFAPKSVTPYDRVKQYPGESFTMSMASCFALAAEKNSQVRRASSSYI